MEQAELFEPAIALDFIPPLDQYDTIIIAFSGGKDSTACFLYLKELGYADKVELWHHEVDGRESDKKFMDWPCTTSYCRAFADAFDVPIYFSWKEGGFKREMLRENQRTAPIKFETPDDGIQEIGGIGGSKNTRHKFPQVSPDLSVRWCSAYLKIDVCASAIRNQNRFRNSKTLVVTGERGQESKARSNYEPFEPHRSDLRNGKRFTRHVDHWRPILNWYEAEVWNIIEKHNIRVHPAYYLGWGRVSCCTCIFGSKDQWASAKAILPEQFEKVAEYEEEFDHTIRQDISVRELAYKGDPFEPVKIKLTPDSDLNELGKLIKEQIAAAKSKDYNQNILMDTWELPAGAFGDSAGPV
jgi:3'-phosphoadenosine 5'-phosphosulfate sulfotransferase (PAPS reductase)/FAD synthetase